MFVFLTITHNPIDQDTCFIIWNTRGVNNANFRCNFYELICNHNPCLVALLETKMSNHMALKDEFTFDDFYEVPTVGNSGGTVLMWLSHVFYVTMENRTDQELYAKI